jgi:hypothetical protein
MSNNTNNATANHEPGGDYVFYAPPTTPDGDRDYRAEITRWKAYRVKLGSIDRYPIDALIIIDNLLDALDAARKERDEGRSPGAWKYIGSPNDRIP